MFLRTANKEDACNFPEVTHRNDRIMNNNQDPELNLTKCVTVLGAAYPRERYALHECPSV